MRRQRSCLLPGILAFLTFALASFAQPALAADRKAQASQAVTLLGKQDFKTLIQSFDDRMKQALPEAKLREVWQMVLQQAGQFKRQASSKQETVQQEGQNYDVVTVVCEFEKAKADIKVVYNSAGKISGLFVTPAQ